MNLVRCEQCGEVAEAAGQQNCMGCDHPLPAVAPTRPPPRRIPAAQREARSDLSASKAVMIGLSGGGIVAVAFIILREFGGLGMIAMAIILAAIGVAVMVYRQDRRKAAFVPSDAPVPAAPPPRRPKWTCEKCGTDIEGQFDSCWKCAAPRAGREVPARFTSPPPVPYPNTQRDNGCVAVLTVLGVIGALIAGGFVIFFIVCMRSLNF